MDYTRLIEELNRQSKTHYSRWRNAEAGSVESAVELALADAFESIANGLEN